MNLQLLKKNIRAVPNWPKNGVTFRDITPVLQNKLAFQFLIKELAKLASQQKIDKIVAIDARGFILASALAYKLKTGLVLVRKKGKLPSKTISQKYSLEYASETLEMHCDSIRPGEKILLVDDVLATGGTMKATVSLVKKLGGKITSILFLIELPGLNGRKKLKGQKIKSLIYF